MVCKESLGAFGGSVELLEKVDKRNAESKCAFAPDTVLRHKVTKKKWIFQILGIRKSGKSLVSSTLFGNFARRNHLFT